MALPSLEILNRCKPETWRALSDWLSQVGVAPERVAPLVEVGSGVPELLRIPLVQCHLRKLSGTLPVVLRLLFYGERIDAGELQAALGERYDWLREIGILAVTGSVAYSRFEIGLLGPKFILADPHLGPGDLVMGAWRSTASLLKMALPDAGVGRALDLGCGAGALAVGASMVARQVVMTDIYPRAIEFGRINLELNRINNIDVRLGDLFEPVRGETFDLMLCQPPFVSAPPENSITYLNGGARGDELVRRILGGVAEHLAPNGRAYFYLQMPNERGEQLLRTLQELLGPDVAVMLLEDGELDLDEYCSVHESSSLVEGYEVYSSRVQRRREHLERVGITSIMSAYLVVIKQTPTFGAVFRVSNWVWGSGSNAEVQALLGSIELSQMPDEELLAAGVRFREEPGFFELEDDVRVECPPLADTRWTKNRLGLLVAATQAPTVGAFYAQLAHKQKDTQPLARELIDVVRTAARQGLVRPA